MAGIIALLGAFLAFVVPLAVPLMAQRWRSYLVILAVGVAFFGWLSWDIAGHPEHADGFPGAFLGGLMLFGFAGGVIARFVMLISRTER